MASVVGAERTVRIASEECRRRVVPELDVDVGDLAG
jgi:hypothetical protein